MFLQHSFYQSEASCRFLRYTGDVPAAQAARNVFRGHSGCQALFQDCVYFTLLGAPKIFLTNYSHLSESDRCECRLRFFGGVGDRSPRACRYPRGNKNCAMANYEYHLSQSESDRLRLVGKIWRQQPWFSNA